MGRSGAARSSSKVVECKVEGEEEEEEEGKEETNVGGGGDRLRRELNISIGIFSIQVAHNNQHRAEVPKLEPRWRPAGGSRWCRRFSHPQLGEWQAGAEVGAWLRTWDAGCGRDSKGGKDNEHRWKSGRNGVG